MACKVFAELEKNKKMGRSKWCFLILTLLLAMGSLFDDSSAFQVSHDGRSMIIDGQRRLIISGAIHYPRSTPEMWPDLIQKAKDGGLDAIDTYVFWNAHEPRKREYKFEGNLDIIRFLREVKSAGLHAILRIGPYVCADWNYGGLPVWLHQIPGIELRTDDELFKVEMQNFTTLIINMLKKEMLLAPQGGPIILTQIENEYGNGDIGKRYGDAGKRYVKWCAEMAESQNTGIPWIMCQQDDAPKPMINTYNGFYFHNFVPNNPKSPKMWTENWSGRFQDWGMGHLHRPAEDLAYAAAIFFQSNGTLLNYYMYHGGTNFGHSAGGPYITTSYDYDAPLDEYGNLRQPKWGHLKDLHEAIKSMQRVLLYGQSTTIDLGNGTMATRYSENGTVAGCFLMNSDTTVDRNVTFKGKEYFLPAKSISLLPDCQNELYNTAKVHTQTSFMVMKPDEAEEEPPLLAWSWREENINDTYKGNGTSKNATLMEQIIASGDASDYLWYITSFELDNADKMTLRVTTHGHGLHMFVNGKLIGSEYPQIGQWPYTFEQEANVRKGINDLILLSVTVGLRNYGAFYDKSLTGIAKGPVQLIRKDNKTIDLSSNKWSYKVGLDGESMQLFLENPSKDNWNSDVLPINRPFTWYKATFKPPLGNEPVVLDLRGMGKGEAWVNGQSIGRFWPQSIATERYGVPCGQCDYREDLNTSYVPCQSGCGEPSQRWYHVPRNFMSPEGSNTLTLFEEIGGSPTQVSFRVVTVGSICGVVPEGKVLILECQGGRTISEIKFASFGDNRGKCNLFEGGLLMKGTCESSSALSYIQKECIGKSSCSIKATGEFLGWSSCNSNTNRLAVQVVICNAKLQK